MFHFSLQLLFKTFFALIINEIHANYAQDACRMLVDFRVNWLLFLTDYDQNCNILADLSKTPQYWISWKSNQRLSRLYNGQTDIWQSEEVHFCNFLLWMHQKLINFVITVVIFTPAFCILMKFSVFMKTLQFSTISILWALWWCKQCPVLLLM